MNGPSTATRIQDASQLDCLDISRLKDLSAKRSGAFTDMLQEYITRTGELLHTLQDSETRRNYEALHQAAGTLKGSSALIGAPRVQHLAEEIEAASDNRDETSVRTGLVELKPAVDRTLALLRDFLHG